jgi:hypothetical protein
MNVGYRAENNPISGYSCGRSKSYRFALQPSAMNSDEDILKGCGIRSFDRREPSGPSSSR